MKAEDIYPNMPVWVRGDRLVWKGTTIREYEGNKFKGWYVRDEENEQDELSDFFTNEILCTYEQLLPRDPNNLDEIRPLSVFEENGI